MKQVLLLFFLGLLGLQTLQAADFCTIQELEHPLLKARAKSMQFADGRTFTLVGHVHGERSINKRFGNWARDPDDELTNEEWTARLEKFIGQNATVLEHAKQDLAHIRASLWNAEQPIFVALEAQDADMSSHIRNAKETSSALLKAGFRRDIENLELIRDAELAYMGGPHYSYLYDSELKEKYELIGMENTADGVRLQKQGKKKMRRGEASLASLKKTQDVDEEKLNKVLASIVDEMNKNYDDIANILAYDQESIRRSLLFRYKNNIDEELRGAILMYLYGYLDYLRGMKKRDVFFTRKLGRQERSGLFFFGQEHLESISRLLELECKYGSDDLSETDGKPGLDKVEEM